MWRGKGVWKGRRGCGGVRGVWKGRRGCGGVRGYV